MSKAFITFLCFIMLLASCRSYRHVYSAAPPVNPFFRNKGNSHLAAFYSGSDGNSGTARSDFNRGADFQAAYAITNRLSVTASYFFRRERDRYYLDFYDTSTVNYKRKLGDFGLGYFAPINTNKTIFFNFYTGLGFGKFNIKDEGISNSPATYSRYHDARIVKWFLQPSVNFITDDNFCLGLVGRFSFVRYKDIQTDYDVSEQGYFFLNRLGSRTFGYFEPSMTAQFRVPKANWLRLETNIGLVSKNREDFPTTRTLNASIGVSFDLGTIKNKTKASR